MSELALKYAGETPSLGDIQAASTTPNTDAIARSGGLGRKMAVSPNLVKGTRAPGEKPMEDIDVIQRRQRALEATFLASIRKSVDDPLSVVKGLAQNSPFQALSMLIENSQWYQMAQWAKNIDKSFTTTSPLSSGLVPFTLVAPTLLAYPVYSPLRNRFPRPQGQGLSHRAKVMTAITGSRPSIYGKASQRVSISELPGGGSLSGTNWPNQLPGSGSQTVVDINIPYKFFGLTEAATWLSQFAGQGFDDIAALASLVLLQEFMLAEERAIIGATGFKLGTPDPTLASVNTTATNKITGVSHGKIYVYVTALNYYGETNATTTTAIAVGGSTVVTLKLPQRKGALAYNVYVATGTTNPGISGAHLYAADVGGSNLTIKGALPTTGPTPPTADTGTGTSLTYEGLFSVLSGHAVTNSVYPSGYAGGYVTLASGVAANITVIANALQQVYNGSTSAYFADPSELWCEASDAKRLSLSLAENSGDVNYTIFIQQDQVANVTAGVAVSQFANPVTRSTVRITVHPYWPQGSIAGLSYTLPQVQTNISNCFENVMVQDYISINWPVIDVTFRYSLFMYGTFFSPAPYYSFLLQGLQKTATAKNYS